MSYLSSFGLWVKTLRTTQRWTQRELADQVGCSLSTIRKIEIDERSPSLQLAQLLAQHLHVPEDQLTAFLDAAHPLRPLPQDDTAPSPSRVTLICNQHGFRPLTPMLGRATALRTVADLLQRPELRLLTLLGPGGVGKTRLAYALTDQVYPVFAQGVQITDLTSISSVDELLLVLATTLNLPNPETRSQVDRVLAGLQEQELLLVLDNIDHLFDAIPVLRQILAAAPGVTLLVTSRAPLRIDGEHEFRLVPLDVPTEADATDLSRLCVIPAITLLIARTQAMNPEFQLTNANADAIATICRQVDGLPLALELASAQLRIWSPQALTDRLAQDMSILTSTSRSDSYQHSLQATVRRSYDLLDQPVQHLFAYLSVFAGGATLEAITSVCVALDVGCTEDLVVQQLNTLVEYSLVVAHTTVLDEQRFTMLETIRSVAFEELCSLNHEEQLKQHHATYFANWLELCVVDLDAGRQAEVLQHIDKEIGNIRLALTWAYTHALSALLARLCVALWRYWYVRGLWDEALTWHQRAITLEGALAPTLRAALLSGAGGLSLLYSDYVRSEEWLDEAIRLYRSLDDGAGMMRTLNRLGIAEWYQGRLAQARQLFEEGLAHSRRIDSPRDTANILGNLGCVVDEQGHYDQAMAFHQASLQIRRGLDDTYGTTADLLNLGKVALVQGDYLTAQTFLEEGLACVRASAYDQEEWLFLVNLGLNACYKGCLPEAHTILTQASVLTQRSENELGQAHALGSLGLVAYFQGDFDRAVVLLNQSVQVLAASDLWLKVPELLERLAYAYIGKAQYQHAHWVLLCAMDLRIKDGSKRPPVEERLYQQAWEQLLEQGFTPEQLRGYEVGQVRAWLAGGAQEPSVGSDEVVLDAG
ncbi:MAG: tetratricopeptide repeat protein [Chloroflexota bacterium]